MNRLEVFSKIDLWNKFGGYLNSRGRCLESWALLIWVVGGLVAGPLAVVVVGLGPPLIFLII